MLQRKYSPAHPQCPCPPLPRDVPWGWAKQVRGLMGDPREWGSAEIILAPTATLLPSTAVLGGKGDLVLPSQGPQAEATPLSQHSLQPDLS